ncbi:MAG: T9SS type A sorting domain-containing protein [Bacteroidetes bacterium]|nr:T9SS type A sorting domain-containing protein [Bacteroidota bacterium]
MVLKSRFILLLIIPLFLNTLDSHAQLAGCTDSRANNYNPIATINDGSCLYDKTIVNPRVVIPELPLNLFENSGMISFNGLLWFHNDSGGEAELYGLDSLTNEIKATIRLTNATNTDWEDVCQDSLFVYVGDFGNNTGTRSDLKIYRIDKSVFPDTGTVNVYANSIAYFYPDQVDFTERNNKHNFDCEAFFIHSDHMYLFSKNWVNEWTKVYRIPTQPGTYVAGLVDSFNVKGLITSADFDEARQELALLGYQNYVPFFWLMFDFHGNDFFSGNKRRFDFPFTQIGTQAEALIFHPDNGIYISSEKSTLIANKLMEMHTWPWTKTLHTGFTEADSSEFIVYPNPNQGSLRMSLPENNSAIMNIQIIDSSGRTVFELKSERIVDEEEIELDTQNIPGGNYFLIITTESEIYRKSIHLVD